MIHIFEEQILWQFQKYFLKIMGLLDPSPLEYHIFWKKHTREKMFDPHYFSIVLSSLFQKRPLTEIIVLFLCIWKKVKKEDSPNGDLLCTCWSLSFESLAWMMKPLNVELSLVDNSSWIIWPGTTFCWLNLNSEGDSPFCGEVFVWPGVRAKKNIFIKRVKHLMKQKSVQY